MSPVCDHARLDDRAVVPKCAEAITIARGFGMVAAKPRRKSRAGVSSIRSCGEPCETNKGDMVIPDNTPCVRYASLCTEGDRSRRNSGSIFHPLRDYG